ncbi:FtsW/RodA/SpoVE family cell cycle protein [Priestia taiwanensis]|uniref:Cell division protein FtsW n=1 Tax=Priestia taiwanensis TaxID=1347902 RepID=A0A917ASR7_9BACI|nr:FtsW/RodA/SpoVE family cell cycle protein [Priestia taiwanensis]MBM7364129.1 cell division protein FtsW (lipid II flippase) [Priestia taiwanensis]GGE71788.1 cell division protein FtsW [Priestia taiwanensis]
MEKGNSKLKIDYILLIILFLLATVSIVALIGVEPKLPVKLQNQNFIQKQIMWYGIGCFVIAVIMIIDFDRYTKICWFLYGIGIVMLLGLELGIPVMGKVQTINGATGWYTLPGGLGNFQPSELMKVIMILVLGTMISQHHQLYTAKRPEDDLFLLGKIFAASLPPLLLIAKQPDLGNTMVISFIVAVMILVAGIRWKYILILVGSVVTAGATLVAIYFINKDFFTAHILQQYQLNRFYGWLSPEEYPTQGYQLKTAMMASGSGGLTGKGLGTSEVYFPEAHTDFIFAVIAEQFGFIGTSIVICLFFLFIYRMIQIALESNDPFGSYICAGVIAMITFQVFQNIGMGIQLLPITGITLPFLSYGGSSLATYMMAIGFVLNVRSRTQTFMFKEKE